MKRTTTFVALPLMGLGWSAAPEPAKVEITEWMVPWEGTRPRDPYVDNEGRVWFVGQAGDYVAYFEPRTGNFKRFDLDPGTGPHNLIVGADGTVWYAGNRAAHIGKLDPRTGEIVKFAMPDPAARDPHTLAFDTRGDIWFTVQGGNFVGKFTVASGAVQLIRVPTPSARPYGIVTDSEGRPWIALLGANKIATVDPSTMQLKEMVLPREGARPRRMAVTSDDKVWYVDYPGGFLGRLDPVTGKVDEWPLPSGSGALPYAMASDDRDRIWLVETGPQPNRLVGFDPKRQEFFDITEIASGGSAVRHMIFHRPTRTLWFGTDTNTIARARVP